MKFEVYCDESQQDAFWSKSPDRAKFLLIGSLWLPAENRHVLKGSIKGLRETHGFYKEIKWHGITRRYIAFYRGLVDLFMSQGDDLRFRCIAVEGEKLDLVRFHEQDAELGFYKFYYQLLKHWILDFNEYVIFCDEKTNREADRLRVLCRTLDFSNITSTVKAVQALPSSEVALIQFCDFLLGAASARMNTTINQGSAKEEIVTMLESRLGRGQLAPTWKSEQKFNIFKINLRGGW
ncbi:MAG: DUF3800 domain-containing protein [Candidatus Sumerlaeia bacterium]|nr:DUF3800 domain-containing protein [Candidatus Sumerlaeia bacterium]